MIVIVGGQARKAGKTRTVCEIISATREAAWTAVKISSHDHTLSDYGDTERYLAAGARRACLIASPEQLPPTSGNLIVESNAAIDFIAPDLFIFVADSGRSEWKNSAQRVLSRADIVVDRVIDDRVLDRVRASL